jgi:CBS domain-containing protein
MRVSNVMHTPAVTCQATATVGAVARLMADRQVGAVVVVDATAGVEGIVTDRDLAVRVVGQQRSADITVAEVMTRDVATVSPRADATEAAAIMMKRRVRRLPVTDDHGVLHGVIALDDLIRHLGYEANALTDLLVTQIAAV